MLLRGILVLRRSFGFAGPVLPGTISEEYLNLAYDSQAYPV